MASVRTSPRARLQSSGLLQWSIALSDLLGERLQVSEVDAFSADAFLRQSISASSRCSMAGWACLKAVRDADAP